MASRARPPSRSPTPRPARASSPGDPDDPSLCPARNPQHPRQAPGRRPGQAEHPGPLRQRKGPAQGPGHARHRSGAQPRGAGGLRAHVPGPSAPLNRGTDPPEPDMETMELHRGRLVDHLQRVVRDLPASQRFYTAVAGTLGIPLGGSGEGWFWIDELFVSAIDSEAAAGEPTGRVHLAFQAADRGAVDAFHAAALAAGGRDNGAPGLRPYPPGYYAAFVLDPDGNNIEAVHHGPAERSAASVRVRFRE